MIRLSTLLNAGHLCLTRPLVNFMFGQFTVPKKINTKKKEYIPLDAVVKDGRVILCVKMSLKKLCDKCIYKNLCVLK